MKFGRTLKNIVMIIMIVVLGAGAWLTMDYAGSTLETAQMPQFSQMGGFEGGMRGGMPDGMPSSDADAAQTANDESGSVTGEEFSSFGDGTQTTPEQGDVADSGASEDTTDSSRKHGQTSGKSDNKKQSGNSRDGSTTTDGNTPQANSDSNGSPDIQGGQPPEMPQGENGEMPAMPQGENGEMPAMPEMQNSETADGLSEHSGRKGLQNKTVNSDLSTFFYVLFAAEWIAITALVMYLILSGFNKKDLHATMKSVKTLLLYAMCTLIVGTALGVLHGEVTEKVYAGSSVSQTAEEQSSDKNSSTGTENDNTAVDASGAVTVDGTEEALSDSYATEENDESAILVKNGGSATVKGAKISKKGDSTNTENSEFYGVNAAVLVQKGSSAVIDGAEITTDAKGANAVFATGENAKIKISNSKITTTGASSARGLDATYGGSIEADRVTVTTQGGSCATLATDRGEGTVKVANSTLETNGSGSPVIYSTGDITVTNTTGTANGSQMVVIEGKNSATVTGSSLTASGKGNRNDVDQAGVMIYQSMSGDAGEGTGTFTATDSSLSIQTDSAYYTTAPMFFITNTDAVINLTNTKLTYGSGVLISAKGTDEWGKSGANGGNVAMNAKNQTLIGNVVADNISAVTLNLNASTLEGTVNGENTAQSVTVKLDASSTWKLTGDSYVTALEDADSSYANIDFNGYTLYVNGTAVN